MYAEGHRYAVPIAGADVHVRNWSIYRQYIEVFNAYIWCAIVCPRVVRVCRAATVTRTNCVCVCVCVSCVCVVCVACVACRVPKGPTRR